MQRNIVLIAAGVVVVGLAVVLLRPEPTPEDKLRDAAEQAGEAAREAAGALGEAVSDATETATAELENASQQLSDSAVEMVESVAEASEATRASLTGLIEEWRASGIITEDGIDFDAALAAVEISELDQDTKTQISALLAALRDAPAEAQAKLQELEALLAQ